MGIPTTIENRSALAGQIAAHLRHLWWWKVRKFDDLYWFQQFSRENTVGKGLFGSGAGGLAGNRYAREPSSCTLHQKYITIETHVIHPGRLLRAEEKSSRNQELSREGGARPRRATQRGQNPSKRKSTKPSESSNENKKATDQEEIDVYETPVETKVRLLKRTTDPKGDF